MTQSKNGRRVCKEVKLLAVRYYLVVDQNYVHVAKHFDCSPRSLKRWIKEYRDEVVKSYRLSSSYARGS